MTAEPPITEAFGGADLDPVDRLLLDEAATIARPAGTAAAGAAAPPPVLAVVGDRNGALTAAAAARFGARDVRAFHDGVDAERRAAAAEGLPAETRVRRYGLEPALVEGATLVIARLPKHSLELEELTSLVATHADRSVHLVAAGRVKHMTHGMNEVLGRGFGRVRASLGRQKARAIHASEPRRDHGISPFPRHGRLDDLDLDVAAHGGVFAGARLDIGTRALLDVLGAALDAAGIGPEHAGTAVDLGCGTGLLAVAVARARPRMRVIATDRSWSACASAAATVAGAGLAERITVTRDDAASRIPARSVDLVVLNPPFHDGFGLDDDAAAPLFGAAARILRPGASLVTVFNAHLPHRTALRRLVGPTQQLARTPKFIVTRSIAS